MFCRARSSIDLLAGFARLHNVRNHHASFVDLVTAAEHGCDMCTVKQFGIGLGTFKYVINLCIASIERTARGL